MNFEGYQELASTTATYPSGHINDAVYYCALGLAGEAGEVANKIKKVIRQDKTLEEATPDVISELGDCLWYLSELAKNLGVTLEQVAAGNISKLRSRRERGVVKGEGDNR